QLQELRPEGGRQVVDRVEADVLERMQGRGLARPADPRQDHERQLHGMPPFQRHATTVSPRSTIAASPTCASRVPGQTTYLPEPVSSAANVEPPTDALTYRPAGVTALSGGSSPPSCTMRQRSPSWTTVAGTPATCTSKLTGRSSETRRQP